MTLRLALTLFALLAAGPALAQSADEFDCVASPARTVKLGSQVTGLLAENKLHRGDVVKAGDPVAQLESSVEQANVALAAADADGSEAISAQQKRLDVAQAALDRSQQLLKSGSVTQSKLDELTAAVEITRLDLDAEVRKAKVATLELARQKAMLERLTIRAPIDGIVTSVDAQVGEFVRQDSIIATIVETDPLYVDAYLPTSAWAATKVGQGATVTLERQAQATLSGRVIVVDSVFDTASDTFGVRVELPNPGNAIPGGQRCKLTLVP